MSNQASIEEIKEICSNSIEAFARIFMKKAVYAATPPFHRTIYRDLMDDSIKKLGIIAPRGHSKSTVTSILFPLWRILFKDPEEELFGIIISESQGQSINFLSVIKKNLQHNHMIRAVFGDLIGEKWAEDEIVTNQGSRFVAKGTGQKVRGMLAGSEMITRPNLIILDDFESETNSGTPEAIDKNKAWISKAVEPSLSDDGRLIAIGTIISQRAYLNTIRKDPTFKVHFYQAIMNNKPIWPERFSLDKLLEKKKSYDRRGEGTAFWQEYMNIPVNMDDQDFKKEWIHHFEHEFILVDGHQPALLMPDGTIRALSVVAGSDLAISEERRADFTVNGALGMDFDSNIYILDYDRMKTSNSVRIIDSMFEQCSRHQARQINIETVQFQQVIANEFRRQQHERGVYTGVVETKPRTAKDARIRSLQSDFARGKVFMRSWMSELEAELLSFPNGAHDDILDMVWLARQLLHPPEVDVIEVRDEEDWLGRYLDRMGNQRTAESWLTY